MMNLKTNPRNRLTLDNYIILCVTKLIPDIKNGEIPNKLMFLTNRKQTKIVCVLKAWMCVLFYFKTTAIIDFRLIFLHI